MVVGDISKKEQGTDTRVEAKTWTGRAIMWLHNTWLYNIKVHGTFHKYSNLVLATPETT